MGLFNKPTYKDVVEFLVALNEKEYQKIGSVVISYRIANESVQEILGSPLDAYKLEYEEVGKMPKKPAKKVKGGR